MLVLVVVAGMIDALTGRAGIAQLHQALALLAGLIEIRHIKPALKSGLDGWPLTVQHRKPGGIAVMPLDHRGLPEHPFKTETKPVRRLL